jgi:hypothetical protein
MGSVKVTTAVPQRPVFLPVDLHAEWDAAIRSRTNVLLVGPSSATEAMLSALKPHLDEPLQQYTPEAGVPMPQPRAGTLVLLEVERLDPEQQAQLASWLERFDERTTHVQVVAAGSERLFGLVQRGAFLAHLYYRLNVVRMELLPSDGVSTP